MKQQLFMNISCVIIPGVTVESVIVPAEDCVKARESLARNHWRGDSEGYEYVGELPNPRIEDS